MDLIVDVGAVAHHHTGAETEMIETTEVVDGSNAGCDVVATPNVGRHPDGWHTGWTT